MTDPVVHTPSTGRRLSADELTARQPQASELSTLPRLPLVGVLENIRSLWNVGSMFRTADALRMEQLYLCGYTAHPPRKEIEKTALGASEVVPWQYWSRGREAVECLRASGYQIIALEHTTPSQPVEEIRLEAPVAFVVGNEVTGVSDEILAVCDTAAEIPMAGLKESLNVAVAFGVAAFSMGRRLKLPS